MVYKIDEVLYISLLLLLKIIYSKLLFIHKFVKWPQYFAIVVLFYDIDEIHLLHLKNRKLQCSMYTISIDLQYTIWSDVKYTIILCSKCWLTQFYISWSINDEKARCQQHSRSIKCNYWLQRLKKPHRLDMFVFKLPHNTW